MARNKFENPANGDHYDWEINHSAEDSQGKTRNITRTAPTAAGGLRAGRVLIKQQSDDGPLILKYTGSILSRAQFTAMWAWYHTSQDQTIYFTDFDGNKFEVQITSFVPKRIATSRNPRDASMPYHFWEYSLEMEVYTVLEGDFLGVAV